MPSPSRAAGLARQLLAGVGDRWPHVRTASETAEVLPLPLSPFERGLLVAAAALHDIGYSPPLARTGFHPVDGAVFLRDHGFAPRLAILVANHSHAGLLCPDEWLGELRHTFPREDSLLADALCYADMSSSPNGARISVEERLDDIARRHRGRCVPKRLRRIRKSIANVEAHLGPPVRHGEFISPSGCIG